MINFPTGDDLLQFLNEFDFLCNNTQMNPLAAAKVALLRKKCTEERGNQREVDLVEYKYRFKAWASLFEKEWKETKWEHPGQPLEEYARDLMLKTMERQKEAVLSR